VIIFVLDSSAVLRYIDNEAGADRVNAIFKTCMRRQAEVCISALQWGEVAGYLRKRLGAINGKRALESLMPLELEIVPASGDRAERAADLRSSHNIPYVDAFAIELTMGAPDRVLVTADYDFKAVEDLARIEFLPAK
jgi:predicted nucleic acid-binding protein